MKTFRELNLKADIRQEKEQTLFFLPGHITADFLTLLKLHQIPYKRYTYGQMRRHGIPSEVDMTLEDMEQRLLPFEKAGYYDASCPTLIVSHCNTNDLFKTAKQFFGPTMNKDYEEYVNDRREFSHRQFMEDIDYILGKDLATKYKEMEKNGKITIL